MKAAIHGKSQSVDAPLLRPVRPDVPVGGALVHLHSAKRPSTGFRHAV